DHFYVSADNQYVLAGSKVNITAAAIDTNYIPMEGQRYRLTTDAGTLEDGVLTTPAAGGTVTVTAENNGKSGSTEIYAVSTPDGLTVRDASGAAVTTLNTAVGFTTALTASATYQHKQLKADPEAFTWTVDEQLGTVDQNGVFTASGEGSGVITVTAGDCTASVAVTVAPPAPVLPSGGGSAALLESFEGTTTIFRGGGSNLEYSLNTAGDSVRIGRASGKIAYELTESGSYAAQWRAAKPSAPAITAPYAAVSLWLYGDGSGNNFSFLFGDALGNETAQTVTGLDFTGWRQATASVPFDGAILQGFQITAPEGQTEERTGTVYMDHILALSGSPDNDVPVITAQLNQEEWSVTGVVADAVDGLLPAESVTITLSGTPAGEYDPATGTFKVALPNPGETQEAFRVTVTAKDISGNIGRFSVDTPANGVGHKFTDIDGYWAADYADFLYNAGITTGYSDGTFRPNENVSRAQFAAMLYRYLGLKDSDYAEVLLPFADNTQIPSYAVAAVRGLYAEGIINGTTGKDGKLYFNSGASLSRAQAAAMIGRTQEKGYAVVDLTFSDGDTIPSYAAFYIQTMAAQGVISGYTDNTFRPHNPITRGQMAKILYTLM
ncbi:MAG: surface layer protein, partial [Oscillibacter sp.]|nr:surface layer protein [Oscillibacter sp.]